MAALFNSHISEEKLQEFATDVEKWYEYEERGRKEYEAGYNGLY